MADRVSSDYYVLCLSHDPALVIDRDYGNPDAALRAAADPAKFDGHNTCDLLVGRYSAPLIEAACPGGPHCTSHGPHADTWTDAGWLRLLHAAYTADSDISAHRLPRCWTKQRVLRLGTELGITEALP